jgi:hypothetical protein
MSVGAGIKGSMVVEHEVRPPELPCTVEARTGGDGSRTAKGGACGPGVQWLSHRQVASYIVPASS